MAARLLLVALTMLFFAPVYAPVLLAVFTAGGGERVAVYSVAGCRCDCCSARGLPGVDGFRVIGASGAEVVVIVAHGFTLDGLYALQVSEGVLDYLLHPLMAATGALVLGEAGGRLYTAATSLAALYALPLRGKTVVLVTCGSRGVEGFASALASLGARVAYTPGSLSESEAEALCSHVTLLACRGGLTGEALRALGFRVVEASENLLAYAGYASCCAALLLHAYLLRVTLAPLYSCMPRARRQTRG